MRHLRCQLPSEDLDALVSITSDEDLAKPHRGIRSHHRRDAARAENALTLLYGNEPIGMQRDWNEELQSCREFPHTSPQERILWDRALYKVTSDFVDAAINGAIGVISGCIPPINPTDPECFHMYVHNNIFFSFAIDADLEKLSKKLVNANSKSWSSISLQSSSDKDSIPVHGESQAWNTQNLSELSLEAVITWICGIFQITGGYLGLGYRPLIVSKEDLLGICFGETVMICLNSLGINY
ncbi:Clustered mitochondria protein [Glycine soja]